MIQHEPVAYDRICMAHLPKSIVLQPIDHLKKITEFVWAIGQSLLFFNHLTISQNHNQWFAIRSITYAYVQQTHKMVQIPYEFEQACWRAWSYGW